MSKRFKLALGTGIFVILLVVATILYDILAKDVKPENAIDIANKSENSSQEKIKAIDFTMYDIDGNKVKLSDYYGKPIVFNFWASWCGPCKKEMPHFDKTYLDTKDDIVFLMVDLVDGQRETVDVGKQFIKDNGYRFPVYFDSDQEAAMKYGISSIPTTFFIDKKGYVVAVFEGTMSEEILLSGIELINK